jgi:hypothetical protein
MIAEQSQQGQFHRLAENLHHDQIPADLLSGLFISRFNDARIK